MNHPQPPENSKYFVFMKVDHGYPEKWHFTTVHPDLLSDPFVETMLDAMSVKDPLRFVVAAVAIAEISQGQHIDTAHILLIHKWQKWAKGEYRGGAR